MKPLTLDDIEPLADYRKHRAEEQARGIAARRRRRIAIGDRLSLAFEDRDTVRYQVQEMAHAEGLERAEALQHELDTYNGILPRPGEVAATLMIELVDLGRIEQDLKAFLGLDQPGALSLRVGKHLLPSVFAPGHSEADRIAAVQYVRFPVPAAAREALARGEAAAFVVAHPRYQVQAQVSDVLRQELLKDLAAD